MWDVNNGGPECGVCGNSSTSEFSWKPKAIVKLSLFLNNFDPENSASMNFV